MESVKVHKQAKKKKEQGYIQATPTHLERTNLDNTVIPVANHSAGFDSSFPLTELANIYSGTLI